jgi:sugar phosphate isomerase/epimerase
MQFGLSTHLFHGERLTRAHLETAARRGFRIVELFATRTHFNYADAAHIDEVGKWLAALGMRAGSMHAPICASFVGGEWGRAFSNAAIEARRRQEALDETAKAMDAARQLGCGTVVVHLGLPLGQPVPAGDNDRGAVRRSLEQLATSASRAGLRLALEVIPNDLSTPAALLEWLDGELELGDAAICLDLGHAHLLGGAPEAVEALGGYIATTHVHDNRGTDDDHLVPFAGTIDWATTLAALWKTGYTGPLVFEVADHGDAASVLERTVQARQRLQGILDELTAPLDFDAARD